MSTGSCTMKVRTRAMEHAGTIDSYDALLSCHVLGPLPVPILLAICLSGQHVANHDGKACVHGQALDGSRAKQQGPSKLCQAVPAFLGLTSAAGEVCCCGTWVRLSCQPAVPRRVCQPPQILQGLRPPPLLAKSGRGQLPAFHDVSGAPCTTLHSNSGPSSHS